MIYSAGGQIPLPRNLPISAHALREMTVAVRPFLCPELVFRGMPGHCSLEAFRSDNEVKLGAIVPYWVVAWPGGQALARWLLDNPEEVSGQTVIDIGCGAGLVAVAAGLAGARRVIAVDTDPNALVAASETALSSGVRIETYSADLCTLEPDERAIVCAGDMWYEPHLARLATDRLRRLAGSGHRILCADPGRGSRPRRNCKPLAEYRIEVDESMEISNPVRCSVFELLPTSILESHAPHDLDAPCGQAG